MLEDNWRKWINAIPIDLPDSGDVAPEIEAAPEVPPVSEKPLQGVKKPKEMVFVQKVVTEIYLYTNSEGQQFGQKTFADMETLGEMSVEKLVKLLNKQQAKRDRRDAAS